MRQSAGGIIIGQDNKIVLVEQHGDSWSFPKGGVDEGETQLRAALREIKEETGLTELILEQELGSYERPSIALGGMGEEGEPRQRTLFIFKTTELELKPQDKEISKAEWFTLDEALSMLTHPKDKEFLEKNRATIEKCLT